VGLLSQGLRAVPSTRNQSFRVALFHSFRGGQCVLRNTPTTRRLACAFVLQYWKVVALVTSMDSSTVMHCAELPSTVTPCSDRNAF
jgi:hypothetical protein